MHINNVQSHYTTVQVFSLITDNNVIAITNKYQITITKVKLGYNELSGTM
jgi:hypothetical protein